MISDVMSTLVLVILFLLASGIILSQNTTFLQNNAQNSFSEYQSEKLSADFESILGIDEPVSQKSLATLLGDAVYYRKISFSYHNPTIIPNADINSYYNADSNQLNIRSALETVMDKLYGKNNYYLEISPKLLDLRLFFVIDGSPSLNNEAVQLVDYATGIPRIVRQFKDLNYGVHPKVFIMAGELMQSNPCQTFEDNNISCEYVYKEQLYKGVATPGWLAKKVANGNFLSQGDQFADLNFVHPIAASNWTVSNDEFLSDDPNATTNPNTLFYCTWKYLDSVPGHMDFNFSFAQTNSTNNSYKSAVWFWVNDHRFSNVTKDLNVERKLVSGWNKFCVGYYTGRSDLGGTLTPFVPRVDYSVSEERRQSSVFPLNDLYAFLAGPTSPDANPSQAIAPDFNGSFYEDWASGSAFAAANAAPQNQATMTMIIPISDELSTGSESEECQNITDFVEKGFCEACNKNYASSANYGCPVNRSQKTVDFAVSVIQPTGYYVFPILADTCDIPAWKPDGRNWFCKKKGFNPYGGQCGTDPLCGECYGPDPLQCPGLTLNSSSVGCDKLECRDAIKTQMTQLATETGGEMIELSNLNELSGKIDTNIRGLLDKFTIKIGVQRPDSERYSYHRLIPLSNRLFASVTFWVYNERE